MKKNFFLFVLFLTVLQTNAQTSLYTLTTTTESYTELEDLIIPLDDGNNWLEGGYAMVDAPFPFKIAGQTIVNFSFMAGNFFLFTQTDDLYILWPSVLAVNKRPDEAGVPTSVVGYKTEGAEGSRILKIEVRNVGSLAETTIDGTNNLFMNFQIWIYEGTDAIEYRYGTSNITAEDLVTYNTMTVLNTFLIGFEAAPDYRCFVYGNLADPTFAQFADDTDWSPYMVTSYPANKMIYRFSPDTTATTDKFNKTQFSMYPNPVTDVLTVSLKKMDVSEYTITDMTGKILLKGNFTTVENTLEIGNLSSGMYFLTIGNTTQKFIKK